MNIRISTTDGIPIYAQIVNQVKYLVAAGRLQPGDQLPPVRRLAEELVINPNTVSRAYRELEAERVIVSRRGSGAFVDAAPSPLAKREKQRRVIERIDALLAEARALQVSDDELEELIAKRRQILNKTKGDRP